MWGRHNVENVLGTLALTIGSLILLMVGALFVNSDRLVRDSHTRLRAAAEAAMGPNFDIKGFHDTVLGSGMVPLETLGRMVQEWSGAA